MRKILIAGMAIAVGVSVASADVLSQYIVPGSTNSHGASSVLAGTTASTIEQVGLVGYSRETFGSVLIFGAGTYGFYSDASRDFDADPGAASTVDDNYIYFTTTADAGQTIQLSSLTFDWGAGSNADDPDTSFGYRVFASVDGGAWTSYGSDETAIIDYTTAWIDHTSGNIDLSGAAATGDGGNVEIRMQLWSSGDLATMSSTIQAFKDFTLNGTVTAIPEPATLGMVAMFGGAILFARRKMII